MRWVVVPESPAPAVMRSARGPDPIVWVAGSVGPIAGAALLLAGFEALNADFPARDAAVVWLGAAVGLWLVTVAVLFLFVTRELTWHFLAGVPMGGAGAVPLVVIVEESYGAVGMVFLLLPTLAIVTLACVIAVAVGALGSMRNTKAGESAALFVGITATSLYAATAAWLLSTLERQEQLAQDAPGAGVVLALLCVVGLIVALRRRA